MSTNKLATSGTSLVAIEVLAIFVSFTLSYGLTGTLKVFKKFKHSTLAASIPSVRTLGCTPSMIYL